MNGLDGLLDTSILISLWRTDPLAHQWFNAHSTQLRIGISVLVAMELVDGARDKAEKQRALNLLKPFPIIHVTPDDSLWAQTQHAQFKLSHNVGIIDALIASASARLKVPIYTLNTKHFTPLPDITVIKPF